MKWQAVSGDGFLLVRVAEKALVRSPDWAELGLSDDSLPALVVLDLEQAEFISSLFWDACARWKSALARRGGGLALLHLDETQRRMLNLVGGLDQVPVFSSRGELQDYVRGQTRSVDSGVTEAEKEMLWSNDHGG